MRNDKHVHLYGCLSPEDLWSFGKERYKKNEKLLEWYASEYEKAWRRKPNYKAYWESENGLELLKSDYLFLKPSGFPQFQANFNLIIALCPILPDDFTVQEHVIRKRNLREKLDYFEARVVIPFRFNNVQAAQYFEGFTKLVKKLNQEIPMTTKIVFSLWRDLNLAKPHYSWLREFIDKNPELGSEITGIDFAGAEEGDPPKGKVDFLNSIKEDNKKKRPLDILYHVGESFSDKSMMSAIRWAYEVHKMGATRLGHATACGLDPEALFGTSLKEERSEALDTVNWLIENRPIFSERGLTLEASELQNERNKILESSSTEIVYNKSYCDKVRSLQKAILSIFRDEEAQIETCPTSNLRIGGVKKLSQHPLKAFSEAGLKTLIATDDPGIFASYFDEEHALAKKIISS